MPYTVDHSIIIRTPEGRELVSLRDDTGRVVGYALPELAARWAGEEGTESERRDLWEAMRLANTLAAQTEHAWRRLIRRYGRR